MEWKKVFAIFAIFAMVKSKKERNAEKSFVEMSQEKNFLKITIFLFCLFVCIFVCMSFCLSVFSFICKFSVCLFVFMSYVCLSFYLSVCLSVCKMFVYSFFSFVCLSVYQFVRQFLSYNFFFPVFNLFLSLSNIYDFLVLRVFLLIFSLFCLSVLKGSINNLTNLLGLLEGQNESGAVNCITLRRKEKKEILEFATKATLKIILSIDTCSIQRD